MAYEQIIYETVGAVGWIRLNRPERLNAMTSQLAAEALDALSAARDDQEVRSVVLTGEGRAFSAGQDLGEFTDASSGDRDIGAHLRAGYNRLVTALVELPKPVVAGVNGVAAGAGVSLALACDVRIASESASFLQAFIRLGLIPDSGGTYLLPRVVGLPKALELSINGEQVDAAEAMRVGLVNRVVPEERFPSELAAFAERLGGLPTRGIGETKRLMREALGLPLAAALEKEAETQGELGRSEDFREGVRAFMEKRQPRFTGR